MYGYVKAQAFSILDSIFFNWDSLVLDWDFDDFSQEESQDSPYQFAKKITDLAQVGFRT